MREEQSLAVNRNSLRNLCVPHIVANVSVGVGDGIG